MEKYLFALLAGLLLLGGIGNAQDDPQPVLNPVDLTADGDGDGVFDDEVPCPESDRAQKVVIDGCDSEVDNIVFDDGCTISDLIAACEIGAENHGEFVSCVAEFTNGLKPDVISGAQKGAIQRCAAQSSIGESCGDPDCQEDGSGLEQDRHRARYELAENDLVIPCVEIEKGQYFAVDMDLTSAASKNFHFKVKKAERVTVAEMDKIAASGNTCAQYSLASNSLVFPRLQIGEKLWQVEMKLLGANSVNLHFKLQNIEEVVEAFLP